MKTLLAVVASVAIAVPATWMAARHFAGAEKTGPAAATRDVLFYQSAMHPWVKSDKPGRCTICGMELTPVYTGEKGFEAAGDVVSLTQNMVQVVNVQTVPAQKRALVKTLEVAGMVDDNATRHRIISAYVNGRIDKLHVNFVGAEVKEGEPLAEIYSAALLQAEREYRQVSGELRKSVGLRLRQMGMLPAQIEALAQKPADALTTPILAPLGGTVVGQDVYEGQYVKEGDRLFEIADFSTMWYMFRAYEQDLPWLRLGQEVSVSTPSLPGEIFQGKIAFIDPNFDEATRATKVRVELANPVVDGRRRLLHRLFADGRVAVDGPEVLTVPRSAVIQTGPEAVVYVDQGSGAYARQVVKLGRRGDTLLEVLSGLSEGDKVVTNGNLLIDGQAEMDRSFSSAPADAADPAPDQGLTPAQQEYVAALAKAADTLGAALAKDDLPAFNAATGALKSSAKALTAALKERAPLQPALGKLSHASELTVAADLPGARKQLLDFSTAAMPVLDLLRSPDAAFDVFECPMVDRAVPGAPKKGRWLQLAGTEIRNPYFGAEMLDCGRKVKR